MCIIVYKIKRMKIFILVHFEDHIYKIKTMTLCVTFCSLVVEATTSNFSC